MTCSCVTNGFFFFHFALFVFTQEIVESKGKKRPILHSIRRPHHLFSSHSSLPTFAHFCSFTMNPHRARKPVDEFDDTPIKFPSQLPPKSDGKNPNVIIVGAGLAGLLLAILLDKAGIPYQIYERAASVKPLGTMKEANVTILLKRGP